MKIDYTVFYKSTIDLREKIGLMDGWDVFISAYNPSARVKEVYDNIVAKKKIWLVFSEYNLSEYPPDAFYMEGVSEDEYFLEFFSSFSIDFEDPIRLVVDITGFLRSHLVFLIRFLMHKGVREFEAIYSEPLYYVQHEDTVFSTGNVLDVRGVLGCEGVADPDTSNDLLVVGLGYDYRLVSYVADKKDKVKQKVVLYGLPSLSPDMYQQSVLQSSKVEESLEGAIEYFAPASDPFVTAAILQEIVARQNSKNPVTNIYLSPLSTKAQALGFALYYVWELQNRPASILLPICDAYEPVTSSGLSRVWRYEIYLPEEEP